MCKMICSNNIIVMHKKILPYINYLEYGIIKHVHVKGHVKFEVG